MTSWSTVEDAAPELAGRAVPVGAPGDDGEMFVVDITEVVVTGLDAHGTRLVVEVWTPDRGLVRVERD